LLEHPTITRVLQTGYPEQEKALYGFDVFGNVVYEGDEIYEFDDEFYLISELSGDSIEILVRHGAERKVANG